MTGNLGRPARWEGCNPVLEQGLSDVKQLHCTPGRRLTIRWDLSGNTGSRTE